MTTVPIVTTQQAAGLPAVAEMPRAPRTKEQKQAAAGRTFRLLEALEATAVLPAATRANIQLQTLAEPEAYSAEEWMGTDGDQ